MLFILSNELVWVEKDFRSCTEVYAVLREVDSVLLIIPLKRGILKVEFKVLIHSMRHPFKNIIA